MSLLLIPNGEQQTQIMGKSGKKEVLLDSVHMLQGEEKEKAKNEGQVGCTGGSLCVKERFIVNGAFLTRINIIRMLLQVHCRCF